MRYLQLSQSAQALTTSEPFFQGSRSAFIISRQKSFSPQITQIAGLKKFLLISTGIWGLRVLGDSYPCLL
jgi:hypothetical protein